MELETLPPSPANHRLSASTLHKAPRRFDLATMFAVTSVFAVFLGVLNATGVPTEIQVFLSGLLGLVGVVQMIVSARYVRWAAVGSGWVAYLVAFAVATSQRTYPIGMGEVLVNITCGMFFIGSVLGYLAGVLVAGVFLIADFVRRGAVQALSKEN